MSPRLVRRLPRSGIEWYDSQDELNWLLERGVRLDQKGRLIVRLPSPDDDLEVDSEGEEATISELMRRAVDRRNGGSRGRRRRAAQKASQSAPARAQYLKETRLGRPAIGEEPRVYVQTTIAPQTRATLARYRMTLAAVFDECARALPDEQ